MIVLTPVSTDSEPSGRKRELPEGVAQARNGRAAVAPIAAQLMQWHSSAARLGARASRIAQRGQPAGALVSSIAQLETEIVDKVSEWRQSLLVRDTTGRVADAERSVELILQTLRQMRASVGRVG